jgi:hypothetical protein
VRDAAERIGGEGFDGIEAEERLHGLIAEATIQHDEWVDGK